MIRVALGAAGIPARNPTGRVVDFHSLPHTYISGLAMSRAPVKVIRTLARHATPTLTFKVYAHVGIHDQSAALAALRPMGTAGPSTEAQSLPTPGTAGPIAALRLPYGGRGRLGNVRNPATLETGPMMIPATPTEARVPGNSRRKLPRSGATA